jgi:hypothetical protein
MTRARKPAPPKRRNPEAVAAWRKGHRVEASAKAYKRRPKHQKPRSESGASDFSGLGGARDQLTRALT